MSFILVVCLLGTREILGAQEIGGGSAAVATGYDLSGLRATHSDLLASGAWSSNAAGETSQARGRPVVNDLLGRVTSLDGWNHTYSCDGLLLSSEPSAPAEGSRRSVHAYDALGRRVRTVVQAYVSGQWTAFSTTERDFLGRLPLGIETSFVGGSAKSWRFLRGPDASGSLEGAGGARGVLAVLKDAASWKAVAADTLGNVLALAGVNGDFTRRTFDPWGNPLVRDASGSLRAATLTERRADYDALPLAWASQEYDPDTGLTHYHFREYSPSLGGWLTRDPIGLAGGYLNLRSYLGNRPADELDVWGLFKSNKHIGITMKALAKTGLSSKCIKIITKANEDQDRGAGTDWIDYPFKEDSPFSDPRNHGDDNRIEETIQLMSSRLRSVSISRCDECKDSYQALREIGKVFHALQDLYSHSTYVETFGEYSESVSELKTWKMWKNDGTPNVPQGVISGSYSYPFDDDEGERTHKHLNKDNEKSERGKLHNAYRHSYYTLAEDVATRATEELWNEIWNGLSSGQKEGIMKCCAGK